MNEPQLNPAQRAYALANGFRASQVLRAAIGLGVFDHLDGGETTAPLLAHKTGIEEGRVRRLVRALVALGLVTEGDDGRFANSPVGEQFVEGRRTLARAQALMFMPDSYPSWAHLEEALRTGRTGHSFAYADDRWQSLDRSPSSARAFNQVMVVQSERVATLLARSIDFASSHEVVDVGGGNGALLAGVLLAHPHLHGIVCDVPAGLSGAAAYLHDKGVAARCSLIEGDFFKSVPPGDVYLLKNIVHDWDDEQAAAILATCRRSMKARGRIVLVERVLPARTGSGPSDLVLAMLDLQMMVELGGKERTVDEYRALLEGAGFTFVRMVEGGDAFSFIEAAAS